jgi:hypothetical protein
MNRDEAKELIPLYAANDLDEPTRAAVAAAIAGDVECQEELREFEALEASLRESLAPAPVAEPAWLDAAKVPAPALVKRHCPYCKDDLDSAARVFCALCMTPHHEECFAENLGCSLLGCGGTRSIAADDPSFVVCASCEKHTPASAPFCAWCRTAIPGEAPPPRHVVPVQRVPRWSLLRFAAAAALLLVTTVPAGYAVGFAQRDMAKAWCDERREVEALTLEAEAESFLRDLVRAQGAFRAERERTVAERKARAKALAKEGAELWDEARLSLDSETRKREASQPFDYGVWRKKASEALHAYTRARELDPEDPGIRGHVKTLSESEGLQPVDPAPGPRVEYAPDLASLEPRGGVRGYELEVGRSVDGERFYAVARPRSAGRLRAFFVNQEGRVEVLASEAQEIDHERCVPAGRILTPGELEKARAAYEAEVKELRSRWEMEQDRSIENTRKYEAERRGLLQRIDELSGKEPKAVRDTNGDGATPR